MVGDRLDTDIEGGRRAEVDSLLVLTGVTGLADLVAAGPELRPTYLAADLGGLLEAHHGAGAAGRGLARGWLDRPRRRRSAGRRRRRVRRRLVAGRGRRPPGSTSTRSESLWTPATCSRLRPPATGSLGAMSQTEPETTGARTDRGQRGRRGPRLGRGARRPPRGGAPRRLRGRARAAAPRPRRHRLTGRAAAAAPGRRAGPAGTRPVARACR